MHFPVFAVPEALGEAVVEKWYCLPSNSLNLESGIKVETWLYYTGRQDKDYHRWTVYCWGGSNEASWCVWLRYRNNLEELLFELSGEELWLRASFWPCFAQVQIPTLGLTYHKQSNWLIFVSGLIFQSGCLEKHRITFGYSCWNWLPSLSKCNRWQAWPNFLAPTIH